jgi:hypothetical protein
MCDIVVRKSYSVLLNEDTPDLTDENSMHVQSDDNTSQAVCNLGTESDGTVAETSTLPNEKESAVSVIATRSALRVFRHSFNLEGLQRYNSLWTSSGRNEASIYTVRNGCEPDMLHKSTVQMTPNVLRYRRKGRVLGMSARTPRRRGR